MKINDEDTPKSNLSEVERREYDYLWDVVSRAGGSQIDAMARRNLDRLRRKLAGDE